jgi:hypothetical protein
LTYLLDDTIKLEQSAQVTAFARLRTAEARLLGEYRYMYGAGTTTEVADKLEGGGTLVKDQPRNCYLARVGTASGDRAVRQTRQYHPYISGTSNLGMITFVPNQMKSGLSQSFGLFDDLNGFILRIRDSVVELVVRKNGVDFEVADQSTWNGDRVDGSMNKFNKSGQLVDWSKAQILLIDYQWLGVGKVRFSLVLGDDVVVLHTFYHSNIVTEVYTNQPSLPCRWEIRNTTGTASNSEMMIICAAVYCEGAEYETGFTRSVSTDGTSVAVTSVNAVNGKGILAIKLKDVLEGKPAHPLARLKHMTMYTNNDINYKIVILPGSAALNGTPSWVDVPGYSWCQYTKDFTLSPTWASANNFHVIVDDFALGGIGNQTGTLNTSDVVNRSTAIYQNYDANDSQIMAIIGYRLVADATVRASMQWIEVK